LRERASERSFCGVVRLLRFTLDTMPAMRSALVAALALPAGILGCRSATPAGPTVVRLIATDYGFTVPGEVPAGLVTLRLVNQGQSWHEALVVALAEGATVESYRAAAQDGADYPPGALDLGGPGIVAPGDSSEVLLQLAPGRHAVICWVDNHVRAGMIAPLQATAGSGPTAAPPSPDIELALTEFQFAFSRSLGRGPQVVHITNSGARTHDASIYRLAEGKTVAHFGAWLRDRQGPPPAVPVGGLTSMAPAHEAWARLSLSAGRYFIACGEPEGDKIHAQLGMLLEFTVP